jgi:hypothetical protein
MARTAEYSDFDVILGELHHTLGAWAKVGDRVSATVHVHHWEVKDADGMLESACRRNVRTEGLDWIRASLAKRIILELIKDGLIATQYAARKVHVWIEDRMTLSVNRGIEVASVDCRNEARPGRPSADSCPRADKARRPDVTQGSRPRRYKTAV